MKVVECFVNKIIMNKNYMLKSAGTLWQLHPEAVEFCSADHVPGVM